MEWQGQPSVGLARPWHLSHLNLCSLLSCHGFHDTFCAPNAGILAVNWFATTPDWQTSQGHTAELHGPKTHTGTTKHNFSLIHVYPQTTLFKIDFPSWYLLIKFINFWQSSSKFFFRNYHKTAYNNSHRQPVLNSGERASRTMMKRSGPRSESWCTTIFTLRRSLKQFSTWTLLLTSQYIAWKICLINLSIPSFLITQQSTWWGTLSKAFCRSTNARYWFLFFFLRDVCSATVSQWIWHLLYHVQV